MRRALLLLLLVPLVCAAQKIYRTVDADGNVTYSDEPLSDTAEEVDLPPISIIETRRVERLDVGGEASAPGGDEEDGEEGEEEVVRYESVRIVTPSQDATFFAAEGPVRLGVTADRPLGKDHTYRIFLDGSEIARTRSGAMTLENVTRGTHTVFAQILDGAGRVRATSDSVTFHYRQPSILTPGRQGNPANARPAVPNVSRPGRPG